MCSIPLPFSIDGTGRSSERRPPKLGEHGDEVLNEWMGQSLMTISWILVGFSVDLNWHALRCTTKRNRRGYRAHWTFDEVRVGTLPALAIRGPKEQVQLMELNFQIPEEGIVQFKVRSVKTKRSTEP